MKFTATAVAAILAAPLAAVSGEFPSLAGGKKNEKEVGKRRLYSNISVFGGREENESEGNQGFGSLFGFEQWLGGQVVILEVIALCMSDSSLEGMIGGFGTALSETHHVCVCCAVRFRRFSSQYIFFSGTHSLFLDPINLSPPNPFFHSEYFFLLSTAYACAAFAPLQSMGLCKVLDSSPIVAPRTTVGGARNHSVSYSLRCDTSIYLYICVFGSHMDGLIWPYFFVLRYSAAYTSNNLICSLALWPNPITISLLTNHSLPAPAVFVPAPASSFAWPT